MPGVSGACPEITWSSGLPERISLLETRESGVGEERRELYVTARVPGEGLHPEKRRVCAPDRCSLWGHEGSQRGSV